MKIRTASLKLLLSAEQSVAIAALAEQFTSACNAIVPYVQANRCWNRVALHHLCYYKIREMYPALGSQMVCQAVHRVADAYKALKAQKRIKPDQPIQAISFSAKTITYDDKTFTLKDQILSLFTMDGRIKVPFQKGMHQSMLIASGKLKEAKLVCRKRVWYFQVAIELPDQKSISAPGILGVDVGENNLAATSAGKIYGGKQLQDERVRYLATRKRLQANGSRAAKRKLKALSGSESNRVKHINHIISKEIVSEAKRLNAGVIRMEDLTGIRERIQAGKRVRSRLHRWAFRQLQDFIAYKAEGAGLKVQYINPAYTSQTCSVCGKLGKREKHLFTCQCGIRRHADVNAAVNIGLTGLAGSVRGAIIHPVFSPSKVEKSLSLHG